MISHPIPRLLASAGIANQTPWNPASLPGVRGWWVPDTLGLTPGAAIPSLSSSGGITNTLAQGTAGRQPAYQLFNGKGAMNFDGVDDVMQMSDLSVSNAAPALVMWMLYQFTGVPATATARYYMGVRTALTGHRMALMLDFTASASKFIGVGYRNTDASATVNRFSTTVSDLNPHVIVAQIIFGGAGAPKLDIWQDGTNILNEVPPFSAANLDSADSLLSHVGADSTAANSQIQGLISQAGINRGSITTTDRQKLEGYLAKYGGIQSRLPSDHPYRNAVPTL